MSVGPQDVFFNCLLPSISREGPHPPPGDAPRRGYRHPPVVCLCACLSICLSVCLSVFLSVSRNEGQVR